MSKKRSAARWLLEQINEIESLLERAEKESERDSNLANSIQMEILRLWEFAKKTQFKDRFLSLKKLRNIFAHKEDNDNYWTTYHKKVSNRIKVLKKFIDSKPEEKLQSKTQSISSAKETATESDNNQSDNDSNIIADSTESRNTDIREQRTSEIYYRAEQTFEEENLFSPHSDLIEKTISKIPSDLHDYINYHEGVKDNIETETTTWAEKTKSDIQAQSSEKFGQENEFICELQTINSNELFSKIDEIEQRYKLIESSDKNFSFKHYQKMLDDDLSKLGDNANRSDIDRYKEAYKRALINDLKKNLDNRIAEYVKSLIEERRKEFIDELTKRLNDIKSSQPSIEDNNGNNDSLDNYLKKIKVLFQNGDELEQTKKSLDDVVNSDSDNETKRHFEKFGDEKQFGDQRNKKGLIDAVSDYFDNTKSTEEKNSFPPNSDLIKNTISDIPSHLHDYIGNHDGLKENIETDILSWAEKTNSEVNIETAKQFGQENEFIEELQAFNSNELFDNIKEIENAYKSIETSDKNFSFQHYKKLLDENLSKLGNNANIDDVNRYKEAYKHALINDLKENLEKRIAEYEKSLIDERRKKFLEELIKKIKNFKRLEEELSSVIEGFGCDELWRMSNTSFKNDGFEILKKYELLLKNDTALLDFAKLLGKQNASSKEVEKEIIEEITIKSEYHPKNAHRGNIVGFEYSNEISRVLPSEIGLHNDPDLENLFYLKFVEKQLLSYSYTQDVPVSYSEKHSSEKDKTDNMSGPIIICVDTSGSMSGTPEQIAKAATLALSKIAIKEKRECFLISFSTSIETLDLSNFTNENGLDTLVDFLRKSFNDGTDPEPALNECLKQLDKEHYKNADVLMISDFDMNTLPNETVSKIKKEQNKGTLFYSLVVGSDSNSEVIACFDESISYNPDSEASRKEFERKIRKIAKHKQISKNEIGPIAHFAG